MILAFITSCEDSSVYDPEQFTPSTGYVIPENEYVIFSDSILSHTINVSCEGSWTCSAGADWFTVSKGADAQTIVVTATPNETAAVRRSEVIFSINDKKVSSMEVIQEGSYATPKPTSVSFGTYASYKTVYVTSNCQWTCSADSDWVVAEKDDKGESLTVYVSENPTNASRTAKVGIYLDALLLSEIEVIQEQPTVRTDYSEYTFRGYEMSTTIPVKSNCSWTCSSDKNWLMVEQYNKGEGLLIALMENTSGSNRTGTVSLYHEDCLMLTITVTQKAADVALASGNKTANCYIVSKAGNYRFPAVKGNSSASVGDVKSVEVLWESFGTSVKPNVGDLIEGSVEYYAGNICFSTAAQYREGNAVIAAKDASGTILWSWHIWLTDQPASQVYYNNAGTMMDRNLGATSAVPGDVGALGLLYQWGRKDPFLASSSSHYDDAVLAESTIDWPRYAYSSSIEYSIENPTTFISGNDTNYDWYYSSSSTDNTFRWTTSKKAKSIYDPCPPGWRVPDGGTAGVWAKALGSTSVSSITFDSTNAGVNFSKKLGSSSTIWYPAVGTRAGDSYGSSWWTGDLVNPGISGTYWAASHGDIMAVNYIFADTLELSMYSTAVKLNDYDSHSTAASVRCIKE